MGNSTISLQDTIDTIAVRGNVNPAANPSGYNLVAQLAIAQDTMNDLIAKRFNWKWNSSQAKPFLTNAYQQDYPQIGLSTIGWLEDAIGLDINSSSRPLPWVPLLVERDIEGNLSLAAGPPREVCWLYNRQLNCGTWPGAGKVYAPLLGAPTPPPNGPMAIRDTNGNILVLTIFGTTGPTAPVLPAGSVEGATVTDGGCVWTVCSPDGQGFRIDSLPSSGGPVWQIGVKFQLRAPKFVSLPQLIDPIPDDFAHQFRRGYNAISHDYSPDPKAQAQFPALRQAWMEAMAETMIQGDREPDSFMLLPATTVAGPAWGVPFLRDPRNPGEPY